MPRVALTDLFIRNLKPDGSQHRFYCNQLHNFGLRLSQAGGKTFFLDVGAPRTRISLGKYPKIPLKDARKKALQILWSDEPLPSSRTLSEAFAAYYDGHISRNCRPATARKLKKLISAQVPHLADRAIASITARDLSSVIETYADRPAAANRLHAVLSAFFRWAQRNQFILRSPLTFPKPHKHQSRDRVLSERELRTVYSAAVQMGYPFGTIIQLCIHCGFRKTEAASVKWTYITEEAITLPKELTKQKRIHAIPNNVAPILASIPHTHDYVFPSEVGTPFTAWSHNMNRLYNLCGFRDFTAHDLRRTFSSLLAKWQCADPHIIELLLGHANALTPMAKVYNRWTYFPQMKAAMERYEQELARLVFA